ncbi:MAG: phage holin family protein [Roseimicrobium sp.]
MPAAPLEPRPSGSDSKPRGLSEPLLRYLEARGILLTIEAQEAFGQIVGVLLLAGLGGAATLVGWLFFAACAASMMTTQWNWSWQGAASVLGALHLLAALAFFFAMKRRLTGLNWFTDTLQEFKKDSTWLARHFRHS